MSYSFRYSGIDSLYGSSVSGRSSFDVESGLEPRSVMSVS